MRSMLHWRHLSIAVAALLASTAALHAADPPAPSVEHTPQQVVEIVIDALQRNPTLANDAGIATVFSFASPQNRATTGPLKRFGTMIKRGYGDMLGFVSSRSEPMEITGEQALQIVWLMQPDGGETGYAFQLERQASGEFEGMWMTEAVVPLGEGPRSGTRI